MEVAAADRVRLAAIRAIEALRRPTPADDYCAAGYDEALSDAREAVARIR